MTKPSRFLSCVIPCFNEEENIRALHAELCKVLSSVDAEMIFVNDGSTDGTLSVLHALQAEDSRVQVISFTRNFGHQAALRAGIREATGRFVITMDADLQHPPAYIPEMIGRAKEGFDVVDMVRAKAQEGFLKEYLSRHFISFFRWLTDVNIEPGVSDFRLLSVRVTDIINRLPERNIFFRGLIPLLGFPTCSLRYDPAPRFAGRPRYTVWKSLRMGVDALFNFSKVPVFLLGMIGILTALGAFCYGLWNVLLKIFTDQNVPGYTDIIASVLFMGGLTLIMLATIMKYLQIITDHIRSRPEYILDSPMQHHAAQHHNGDDQH